MFFSCGHHRSNRGGGVFGGPPFFADDCGPNNGPKYQPNIGFIAAAQYFYFMNSISVSKM
jgi:hypothetical protein